MHKEKNCRNSLVLTKPQLCNNFPVNYHINLANCDRGFILVYINPRGALRDCLCLSYGYGSTDSWFVATLKRGRARTSDSCVLLIIGNNHETYIISLLETLKDKKTPSAPFSELLAAFQA